MHDLGTGRAFHRRRIFVMTSFRINLRGPAFRRVLGFTVRQWCFQPLRLSILIAAILAATSADVLIPFFSGRLIGAVSAGGEAGQREAVEAFLVMLGLGAFGIVMRQLQYQTLIGFTLRIMSESAARAFHRLQRFSTDWHANSFAGATVRKVGRGMWAIDLLNDTLLLALLPSTAMLIGTTVLLGWFWPLMGAVVLAGTLLYIAFAATMTLGVVAPAARLANRWDTKLGGVLADAVSCNAVVKAFAAESREDARLEQVLGKWVRRYARMWRRGSLNTMMQGLVLLILQIGIVSPILFLWTAGKANAGDIVFVLTSFLMLKGYLREMGGHIRNLQRSVNDMEELVAIEAQPAGVADRKGAGELRVESGRIAFENVAFHYGSGLPPLYDGLSVEIAAGERVGLVGPSGSGKTTFAKLIQRLYDVTGGRIRIDEQDIAGVTQTSLRRHVAIVPQEPVLFHRSLIENIAYARPGATVAEIEAAARLAGIHDFIASLPRGYATQVGERGVKLSGGERQRVAIARAFLADAPILILDEATSSLDSESEALIQKAMQRLMVGRTTLVIAHRLSTVRTLDRLLVFDRGRIVEQGSHAALLRQSGVYRRLFEMQTRDPVLAGGVGLRSGVPGND
jgi:ATP-binding cassette, subfamily B, bacterial